MMHNHATIDKFLMIRTNHHMAITELSPQPIPEATNFCELEQYVQIMQANQLGGFALSMTGIEHEGALLADSRRLTNLLVVLLGKYSQGYFKSTSLTSREVVSSRHKDVGLHRKAPYSTGMCPAAQINTHRTLNGATAVLLGQPAAAIDRLTQRANQSHQDPAVYLDTQVTQDRVDTLYAEPQTFTAGTFGRGHLLIFRPDWWHMFTTVGDQRSTQINSIVDITSHDRSSKF